MNLVDPDGKTWVNKQKQIVCDANGPTVYATPEEVELIKAMNSIKTGRQQLQKLIEAPFDVQVNINSTEKSIDNYGNIKNTIKINKVTKQYTVIRSLITIYKKNAEDRASSTGLSITQAMAVNLAHEIEHATKENIELSINKADKTAKEAAPNQISQQMITEFILMTPLPRVEVLPKITFQQLYYQEIFDSVKLK